MSVKKSEPRNELSSPFCYEETWVTLGILPAVDLVGKHALVGIFYFVGFGLFCLESLLSIWVIQQVYMYFRGSGAAAEMRREVARGAVRAAM
ncbi:secretory carrier-associated membrane protein 2-like protein [Tanacetum coccineum]